MSKDAPGGTERSDQPAGDGRLDSWKEIAAYLKRDVTTVRRWEKREGLPVHRHLHDTRDSVYAYTNELDDWRQGRHNHLGEPQQSTAGRALDATTDCQAGPAPLAGWIAAALLAISTVSLAVLLFRAAPRRVLRSNDARFGYPSCRSRRLRLRLFAGRASPDVRRRKRGTTRVSGFVRSIR